MPRVKRQGPQQRRRELTSDERAILMGGDLTNPFSFFVRDEHMLEAWEFARDLLLRQWIRIRPGTRPPGWWRFDAPAEARRRLGGVGTPAHEVLAYVPQFDRGVPNIWVDSFDVAYYNGRGEDVNGERIGTEFHEGDFDGVAIDPADPPRYESEATFLRRLGLLLSGEEERIPAEDFEPILVEAPEVKA